MNSNNPERTYFLIKKSKVQSLLNNLYNEYKLFVPVEEEEVVDFRRYEVDGNFTLEFTNTLLPPKGLFLPQQETLFTFNYERDISIEEKIEVSRRIIVGIRPCDSKSLTILDEVFKDVNEDVYYLQKRNNTLLIGLGCTNPQIYCFCSSLEIDPGKDISVDIFLTDLEDSYLVSVNTERGQLLIKDFPEYFEKAGEDEITRALEIQSPAREGFSVGFDKKDTEVFMDVEKIFEHPVWEELAETCLGCGICTYLCSTCHCFDITDELTKNEGRRFRCWDSCQFFSFTNMASGHNPRPDRKERIRQRFMHKLSYFVSRYGCIACVGCGRCLKYCPVDIDITRVIGTITNE
ncbi:MAG: Anaerobic sulfite reductase subunit A [candidate division WS2 bacterium]|nr:Anaerobic sulfite reductase subunit A [Candidatus Lithacetigena glycinireducens]